MSLFFQSLQKHDEKEEEEDKENMQKKNKRLRLSLKRTADKLTNEINKKIKKVKEMESSVLRDLMRTILY